MKPNIEKAQITAITEEKEMDLNGSHVLSQTVELTLVKSGQKITTTVQLDRTGNKSTLRYSVGDYVKITSADGSGDPSSYYITDYARGNSLWPLLLLFIAVTVLIAKKRGIMSLLGMIFSFFIIFSFLLPRLLTGSDPVLTVVVASLFIVPVSFILSHGFNRKTLSAIFGTSVTMVITGFLAAFFAKTNHLSGYSSEEAGFLTMMTQGDVNLTSLLVAGLLVGILGVMDDITVSQSAIVEELYKTNPRLSRLSLFSKGMRVGHDHIASMVNTLILVYAGSSLPLLLLFIKSGYAPSDVLDFEIVAEEIVRTLVGSIGLILSVPITTFISSLLIPHKEKTK